MCNYCNSLRQFYNSYFYIVATASQAPPIDQNLPKDMQQPYPLLTKYSSFSDYVQIMVPLIMMEIWEMVRFYLHLSGKLRFVKNTNGSETHYRQMSIGTPLRAVAVKFHNIFIILSVVHHGNRNHVPEEKSRFYRARLKGKTSEMVREIHIISTMFVQGKISMTTKKPHQCTFPHIFYDNLKTRTSNIFFT